MPSLLLLAAAAALAYQSAALLAALAFYFRTRLVRPPHAATPPVSILKPVCGLDPQLEEAIASHLSLDYPDYEIIIGFQNAADPARRAVERLLAACPTANARTAVIETDAPNAKTGVLAGLARLARHGVLVVNDADIVVPPSYLRHVTAPLVRPEVGLVTCLYRARAASLPGCFEALGIATDFMPSALTAPWAGVREFGFGSTLCFRRTSLDSIGGFQAFGQYVADDYQLAARIGALGLRTVFAGIPVLTYLADPGWRDVWRHQLRWARAIRFSRPAGFAGLPITHAGLWALLNLLAGNPGAAATLWLARAVMGAFAGFAILGHWPALLAAPLLPLWDFWAFAVWLAAWCGRTVWWRGRRITLERGGRIAGVAPDLPPPTSR